MTVYSQPARRPKLIPALLAVAMLSLVSACGSAPATPSASATAPAEPTQAPPTAEPVATTPAAMEQTAVSVTNGSGTALAGTLFGAGSDGVLLAHMRPADQTSWHAFATRLAESGWMVLALDFSGYGASDGERSDANLAGDLQAGLDFLAARGASRLVCIGASMGGTACGRVSQSTGVVGAALISSPIALDDTLTLTADDVSGTGVARLFVSAKLDGSYTADIEQLHAWAADPKSLVLLSGVRHGTDLLDSSAVSDDGHSLETVLADFLATLR